MDYILYSTDGLTEDPAGNEVNNCQILKTDYGVKNPGLAIITDFVKENPVWEGSYLFLAKIVSDETLASLQRIVDYLWKDEEKLYEESLGSGENVDNHIYNDVKKIAEYLNPKL